MELSEILQNLGGAHFLLVQAIGFVGFAIFAASFQLLKPRHTILTQSFSNLWIGAHFWGLGYGMPTFIAFAASVRDLGSGVLSQRVQRLFLIAYMCVLYVAAIFLVQGWVDWCAVLGASLNTAAQFFRERFYIYRCCLLGHQCFWLVVYTVILSIPGLIFMSGILISNVIGIGRYLCKNRA
ncbi:MAG: YgjV family protein [Rhodospirillales bacterium]|nr:YgjV family protein [Rhodospirillales bacterium]